MKTGAVLTARVVQEVLEENILNMHFHTLRCPLQLPLLGVGCDHLIQKSVVQLRSVAYKSPFKRIGLKLPLNAVLGFSQCLFIFV